MEAKYKSARSTWKLLNERYDMMLRDDSIDKFAKTASADSNQRLYLLLEMTINEIIFAVPH